MGNSNGIPGILPPQVQFDLADEMGRLGYDATGATAGKGWKEFSKQCTDNPGTCLKFDEIRQKLSAVDTSTPLGQLEDASNRFGKWVIGVKGQITNTFA